VTVDLNHGSGFVPDCLPSLGERINGRIDAALAKARAKVPRRTYLGASMLADLCARRVALEYQNAAAEPFEGRALRIFATGHVLEDLLAQWLGDAGFDLRTIDPLTGEQFAFRDGPIEGHADGVIVAGPDLGFAYPLLWEAKGLNDRSWSDLVKNGLRASRPIYWGQVNLYMAYLGFERCLLSALNKNTSEIWHELVALDRAEVRLLVELAIRITAGWLPPRVEAGLAHICEFCRFKPECWSARRD
jgi:hypothetical protein